MGAALRLPMGGPLRREVLENQYLFSTVAAETRGRKGPTKRPKILTGDSESVLRFEKRGDLTVADFTYSLDDDSDPANGRIYLNDRFVFDSKAKRLVQAERSFRLSGGGNAFWSDLHERLVRRVPPLSADWKGTKKFFNKVVLQVPDFSIQDSSEFFPLSFRFRSKPPSILIGLATPPRSQNLLNTLPVRRGVSFFSEDTQGRVDLLVRQFMAGLGSPLLIGSLFAGGAAFHWAEAAVLSRFGGLGARSALLATGAGVALEAPVFGLTQRSLHRSFLREDPKASPQEIFRNVLSFGALRGAGLGVRLSLAGVPESALLYGRATFPIFHHAASFGTLHTLHEMDRLTHPSPSSWASRVLEDGLFYLQAGAASHLAQGALGPRLFRESLELRRMDELKVQLERLPETHWMGLRYQAQVERLKEGEERFLRLKERAEKVLEGADAQEGENALLRTALQETAVRAKTHHARVQELEGRLKRNKEGTEKVIEWARLKEKENAGIRAGLEDALQQIEILSAEASRLKSNLDEMTAEFVRRDREASRAERKAEDLEGQTLIWEEEKATLLSRIQAVEAELAQFKARFGSEIPQPPRISTIVLSAPDAEVAKQKDK